MKTILFAKSFGEAARRSRRPVPASAIFRDDELNKFSRRAKKSLSKEEQKLLRAGVSKGSYHYLGTAKIMAPIGKAFVGAMAKLQKSE